MAYKKFNIYGGINISEKAVSVAIIIGLLVLAAIMVLGNRVGFTASFESNGEVIYEQHLHYGDKVSEPTAPIREGYVFTGW
ncbi:MAG: InlB B-repeat-containing protein [Clostridia bacterium]|nr:InlB B-repeat-containing protein [Clostridia bacterium]